MARRLSSGPPVLYSLSQRQTEWLRRARDTDGGVYVGSTAGDDVFALVSGGCATYREVRQRSGTRSVHDSSPCEWTDFYLVPTEHGLGLLSAGDRRARTTKEQP